jgi:hypothetical protein
MVRLIVNIGIVDVGTVNVVIETIIVFIFGTCTSFSGFSVACVYPIRVNIDRFC